MKRLQLAIACALVFSAAPAAAVDVPWCASAFPEDCVDDVIAVELDAGAGATDRVSGAAVGDTYPAIISCDVRSDGIQGWSYGMYSDDDLLEVVSPAPAPALVSLLAPAGHFEVTVASPEDGLVQAIVLSFTTAVTLPLGAGHPLAELSYSVLAEPGPGGTLISVSDDLKSCSTCPPAATILTVWGESTTPRKVRGAVVEP